MKKKVVAILFAAILTGSFAAFSATTAPAPAPAGICVWNCQMNPSGSYAYWFSRALSDCPVTDCLPRGGSSPSGTACDPGDPDIPGDCRAAVSTGDQGTVFSLTPPGALVCRARF
ncbi:MAG TPA: hypothetical protein VFE25_03530 [Opitutaceae bacterium]|jgi:hypothetical protein|nr:hypothetical protein [Opitutaceae bacterium]